MTLTRFAYTEERKRKDARLFIRRMRDFHRFSNLSRFIMAAAKCEVRGPKRLKNGKLEKSIRYECASCHGKFRNNLMEIDHINEMGGLINIKNWDWSKPDSLQEFAAKYLAVFLQLNNHQVLCRACHRLKTMRMEHLWK